MYASLLLLVLAAGTSQLPLVPVPKPPPELSKETLARVLKQYPKDEDAIKQLFQIGLGRKPTEQEKKQLLGFVAQQMMNKNREATYGDILWVIVNSKEYLTRHPSREKPTK